MLVSTWLLFVKAISQHSKHSVNQMPSIGASKNRVSSHFTSISRFLILFSA